MSTYGDISPRVGIYAVENMLAHAEPISILTKMGQVKPVPKNRGQVVKFRRPVPWSDPIVGGAGNSSTGSITNWTAPALTEGVTPSATSFSYVDVQVTLGQYGNYVEITDKIQDLHEDPVLNDQTQLAGENAAETMELITYNVLRAGTTVKYLGGAARANVNSAVTLDSLRAAVRNLQAQRAKKITSILGPSTNISTRPVEAAYVAFCHTDCQADIRALTGFTPTAEYGSRQTLCPEEFGTVEDIRFVTSPLFAPMINLGAAIGGTGLKSTAGSNIDVYPIMIVGKEAYGTTPLKGMQSAEIKVLNPGTPRGGDPLGQRGTVGWKAWFAAVRLNESWMYRLEVGVKAL
ncbi:MAG TPA: N4-gp56 family major capsid protein [Burkholderiaceae bacterium]|nr:N4-gp56 family major capsid protein [Burkholderiaceae bacterium]